MSRTLLMLLVVAGVLLAPLAQSAGGAGPRQEVASSSALLVDLSSNEVLYSSNANRVVPIASVTKLMTALVVLDAKQSLDEYVAVNIDDVPEMRGVFSRVQLGSEATRRDLLLITLMSSENRAAATLAHHYPGGGRAFVAAMNAKARELGMRNTRFAEPTGLSRHNVSTAEDLVKLIRAIQQYPVIGWFSAAVEESVTFRKPAYSLPFRNTNALVRKPDWSIQVTKTGYTAAAGRCLVMQTQIADRPVALVVLDAYGKFTHVADASRLKTWLETGKVTPVAPAALAYKRDRLAQRSAL